MVVRRTRLGPPVRPDHEDVVARRIDLERVGTVRAGGGRRLASVPLAVPVVVDEDRAALDRGLPRLARPAVGVEVLEHRAAYRSLVPDAEVEVRIRGP